MAENAYKLLSKVPLTYKFHHLNRAIASEDFSIPGYIYEETCKITFHSPKECSDILEFLLLSLEQSAGKEKLKTLKVMRYLVSNGDDSFREMLQKRDRLLKEATGATGSRDPMHGDSLYVLIRSEAKDLLHLLFEDFNDSTPMVYKQNERGFQVSGMGSQAQTGKYEGFGNAPIASNKTIVDKVVGTLTDMVDKILNAPDEDTEVIRNALEVDSGGYHAVKIQSARPESTEASLALPREKLNQPLGPAIQRARHIPGRAGGGWEDDDFVVDTTTQQSVWSTESVGASELRTESEALGEDHYNAEEEFVDEILQSEKPLTSWRDIDTICRRCTTLNCDKILELFHKRVLLDNDFHKMQILTILEALLYQDIMQTENISSLFCKCLQNMATDSKPLQHKSKKLLIILEKLLLLQNEQTDRKPLSAATV